MLVQVLDQVITDRGPPCTVHDKIDVRDKCSGQGYDVGDKFDQDSWSDSNFVTNIKCITDIKKLSSTFFSKLELKNYPKFS